MASDERHGVGSNQEGDDHDFRENFTAGILRHFSVALSHQRSGDHRLVWLHVIHARDAHARRLDDVDVLDTDAGTDMARRHRLFRRHMGRDDDGDDAAVVGANALELSPDDWQER